MPASWTILTSSKQFSGLLCLGYLFHPPARPGQLRTKHLVGLKTPTLIVQSTRDEFGAREVMCAFSLSPSIEFLWIEDGDHDLRPRNSISGFSTADHLKTLADAVAIWAERIMK
jgi:predicted alpha/beta-hydrolase family hydrolase